MMAAYSVMEDEMLCNMCLIVSMNFVGMKQVSLRFSQNIHFLFREQKYNEYYNLHMIHECNVKLLTHQWYTIFNFINMYHCAVRHVKYML